MGDSLTVISPQGKRIRIHVSNDPKLRVTSAARFYGFHGFVPKAYKVSYSSLKRAKRDISTKWWDRNIPTGFEDLIRQGGTISTPTSGKNRPGAITYRERKAFAEAVGSKAINIGYKRDGQLISTVRKSVLHKAAPATKPVKQERPAWAKNVKNYESLSSIAKRNLQKAYEQKQAIIAARKSIQPQVEKTIKEFQTDLAAGIARKFLSKEKVAKAPSTLKPTAVFETPQKKTKLADVRGMFDRLKKPSKSKEQRLQEIAEVVTEWEKKAAVRSQRVEDFFEIIPGLGGKDNFVKLTTRKFLAFPARATVGLVEQIGISGVKAGGLLLARDVDPKGAKIEATKALKATPKALGKAYDPRTPDGLANILGTGTVIALGVAKGKAAKTFNVKKGVKVKVSKSTVKPKVGSKYNIRGKQTGKFVNQKGQNIKFIREIKLSSKTGKGTATVKYYNAKTGKYVGKLTQKVTPTDLKQVTTKIGQSVAKSPKLSKSLGKLFKKKPVKGVELKVRKGKIVAKPLKQKTISLKNTASMKRLLDSLKSKKPKQTTLRKFGAKKVKIKPRKVVELKVRKGKIVGKVKKVKPRIIKGKKAQARLPSRPKLMKKIVGKTKPSVTRGPTSLIPWFDLPTVSGLSPLFINLSAILQGQSPSQIQRAEQALGQPIPIPPRPISITKPVVRQKEEQLPDQIIIPGQRGKSRTRTLLEQIIVPTTTAATVAAPAFILRTLPRKKDKKSGRLDTFSFTPQFWTWFKGGQKYVYLPDLYALLTGERAKGKQRIRLLNPKTIFTGLEARAIAR